MEKPGRNDPCWCGSGKKYKKCHIDFDEKIEEFEVAGHIVPSHEILKNAEQIEKIKESAKINIAVLDYVAEHIKAGISTAEIDKWVYDITTKMGGVPAPLNFEGFPKSVCTSINNEVCHGIPSENVSREAGVHVPVPWQDIFVQKHGVLPDVFFRHLVYGCVAEQVVAARESGKAGGKQSAEDIFFEKHNNSF